MSSKRLSLWCLKLAAGPLLLLQGWWVRKRTPLLPEPVDQTAGSCGQGPALRLLLIGDSSAAGVGANHAADSLLGQLIDGLIDRYTLSYSMLAQTGRTTADMLAVLQQTEARSYDVVISALGVNDVTAQVPVSAWQQQQTELIDCLKNQFSAKLIILSGLPLMHKFPALNWPLNSYLGGCADLLDETLSELCDQYPGVEFHSLRGYPETAAAASDGFHPGPEVYRHWAGVLVTIIADKLKIDQD